MIYNKFSAIIKKCSQNFNEKIDDKKDEVIFSKEFAEIVIESVKLETVFDYYQMDCQLELPNGEKIYFCPFHQDTSTPNLYANFSKGLWYCFAESEGGNALNFVEKIAKTNSFKESILILAEIGGLKQESTQSKLEYETQKFYKDQNNKKDEFLILGMDVDTINIIISKLCGDFLRKNIKNKQSIDKIISIYKRLDLYIEEQNKSELTDLFNNLPELLKIEGSNE